MLRVQFILFCIFALSNCFLLLSRNGCAEGYELCSPDGASNRDVPAIGPGLNRLYLELLYTINPNPVSSTSDEMNTLVRRESPDAVCCAAGTQCVLVRSFWLPACYDKFTTNYFLPDGSYGSITSGNYTDPSGDFVNLVTGDYEMGDGRKGNIYQDGNQDKPNTSTLPMPTPFTSEGVGSAIPASELGGFATYTTVIPGTTIPPVIVPATTIHPTATYYGYGDQQNATTVSEHTIPGTSVSAFTSVYTSSRITPPISNKATHMDRNFLIWAVVLIAFAW